MGLRSAQELFNVLRKILDVRQKTMAQFKRMEPGVLRNIVEDFSG